MTDAAVWAEVLRHLKGIVAALEKAQSTKELQDYSYEYEIGKRRVSPLVIPEGIERVEQPAAPSKEGPA